MPDRLAVFLPFLIIAVIALAEFLMARAWLPAYFRYGLPVMRVRLHGVRLDAEAEARLATIADHRASKIAFRRLSEGEIAFREKGASSVAFRYTPILHGLLRYAPEEGATYVIGWLNLFPFASITFIAWLFLTSSHWDRPWELMAWFAFIFGVMLAIGVWRYRMVVKALRSATLPAG